MRTVLTSDGLTLKVGATAAENEAICKTARQNDLWFHLDGQPSPHAVLSVRNGKAVSDNDVRTSIHEAAQLVKYFSSARNVRQCTVIFVEAKFVSKASDVDKLGTVNLKRKTRSRVVVADEAALADLLARISKS